MRRIQELLRFWFTFESPVSRGAYLRHGFALMLLKYLVDTTLIWIVAHIAWTPWDYLRTGAAFATSKLGLGPAYLLPILALWTLPFLWVGLTMSIRRALDAGQSAWLALLFFIPVLNYALMLILGMLPARASRPQEKARAHEARLPSALLSVGVGLGIGIALVVMSVYVMRDYGVSLFLGVPFVVGALSAYLFNRRYPASARETIEVVALTLAAMGGTILAFGVEGAICLLMALPLAIGIAALGALVGRVLALRDGGTPVRTLLALVIVPSGAPFLAPDAKAPVREVRSAMEIAAPPELVWPHVIAFSPLPAPSRIVARSGIAYPRRARIVGLGVGAVRYCEFSTGAFVEPITAWEPGRRLAFDVVAQPAPLREWSPYTNISPPHLSGYFRATRGEFRLVRLTNGHTRLEGSTWYQLRIEPIAYWSPIADGIVRRIHQTVLSHIQAEVPLSSPSGRGR